MLSISKYQQIWTLLHRRRVARIAVGHVVVMTVLGIVLLSGAFAPTLLGVFAQAPCSTGDRTYVVHSGDTLGAIAFHYGTSWPRLSSYNRLSNPNLIYINQHICIPGGLAGVRVSRGSNPPLSPMPIRGMGNLFPGGECTWWANQRYFQLHGVFVPWTMNSNAWQWVDRAYEFHWRVSSSPSPGSIVVLQRWTQGAREFGHVAVVERVLNDGSVVTSNLNWGMFPWQVSDIVFSPGPGISFVTF